jgi:hypothetical protein
MTYYILHTQESELVGVTINQPVALPGISIIQVDEAVPDLNKSAWNPNTLSFVHITAQLTRLEFLTRFTTSERIAIRASTDPIVVDFMELLNLASYIDVGDQNTIDGVNYLASQNLIAGARVEEILA